MQQDILNDALSTIKNAGSVGKAECMIKASKLVGKVLGVMREKGYISSFEYVEDGRGGKFNVKLSGAINNCGVIKPRFSVKRKNLEKFESRYLLGQDFGVLILTTTEGVVSHSKAKEIGRGGKLLAYVY